MKVQKKKLNLMQKNKNDDVVVVIVACIFATLRVTSLLRKLKNLGFVIIMMRSRCLVFNVGGLRKERRRL